MPAVLNLTLNGESRRTAAATVADLVRELGLDPAKVAVEHNGEIAPRSTLEQAVLADGDDQNDPVVDTARSILDGHIVLTRALADAGRAPALVDDEVYVFHQWPVDDADDQTRH